MIEAPKCRRRWRLPVLIAIFFALTATGLYVRHVARETAEAADYGEVVQAILDAGGKVRYDFTLPAPCSRYPYAVVEIEAKTDESLRNVCRLRQVRHVTLSSRGITDAGLMHLEHSFNLESLYLENTQVTDQGIERLRRALPDCRVTR